MFNDWFDSIWTDGVDSFGNLCIIQRNVNSKFSNLSPEAKKTTFDKMISKGSLKLRIMSEKTYKHDKMSASVYWREVKCIEHEKEMISLLKKVLRDIKRIISNKESINSFHKRCHITGKFFSQSVGYWFTGAAFNLTISAQRGILTQI